MANSTQINEYKNDSFEELVDKIIELEESVENSVPQNEHDSEVDGLESEVEDARGECCDCEHAEEEKTKDV